MKVTLVCEFFVAGKPQVAGSKNSFVPINKATGEPYRDKYGRVIVNTVDTNAEEGKAWRSIVVDAARPAFGVQPLLDSSSCLEIDFRLARPKGHYRTNGELRPSAPAAPDVMPDATKLTRCLEDGLKGVVWTDDARVTLQVVRKSYAEDGRIGAFVRIWRLPATVAELGVTLEPLIASPEALAHVAAQGSLFV